MMGLDGPLFVLGKTFTSDTATAAERYPQHWVIYSVTPPDTDCTPTVTEAPGMCSSVTGEERELLESLRRPQVQKTMGLKVENIIYVI